MASDAGERLSDYFALKLAQRCTRCGVELGPDDTTGLCEPHRVDNVMRATTSRSRRRAARRLEAAITAVLPEAHIVIRRAC